MPHVLAWSRETRELIFGITTDRRDRARLLAVPVTDGPGVQFGAPTALFDVDMESLVGGFDVTPDGKSIVITRRVADDGNAAELRYVLAEPWLAEFRK